MRLGSPGQYRIPSRPEVMPGREYTSKPVSWKDEKVESKEESDWSGHFEKIGRDSTERDRLRRRSPPTPFVNRAQQRA